MITQTYSLDLIPNFAPLVVHVSQYDVGSRTLVFNLTKSGVAYSGSATGATIKGTKPDGNGFMYSMTLDGSTASIVVTEQMTAVAGMATCEVVLTDGTAVLGSANFTLFVEHTALDSETVISDTDIPVFEELTRQAVTASTQAKQYAQQAQESAESIDVSALEAQIASKAPSVSPTLRFGIKASADGDSNPHVELRETGSTPTKGMGIAIYNDDGTLKSINDLVTSAGVRNFATVSEVNDKAPIASPALTGTPTAPTAPAGTNTTQIATTAYVQNSLDNLYYSAGDTYASLAGFQTVGMTTNGNKNLYLTVTVPKLLTNINSITVTRMIGAIRGVNGYIGGSSDGNFDWLTQSYISRVTASKVTDNQIRIIIFTDTALSNATNNTPVVLNGQVTFTFS